MMIARLFCLYVALLLSVPGLYAERKPPNFLIISIDDLNDWVVGFEGHPQAVTPNIDRLAARGMRFTNAHCQAPVCNPSRASMGVSLYPSTTGIYFLNPDLLKSEVASRIPVFPRYFQSKGYAVSGAGKLFHYKSNEWHLPNWAGSFGGMGPLPEEKLTDFPGHPLWDWGAFPDREEQTPDYKVARWGVENLEKAQAADEPFMLVTGFFRPHVPHYAPRKWMDLFPLDEVQLPETLAGDLNDLSGYAIDLTRLEHVAPTHEWVVKNGEWKPLVKTYLGCVAFVDHQVGRVLDALEESGDRDTYVILFSDHGFHLGEKERWAKRSLWEDSTRVPLIIAGPGISPGAVCKKPIGLIDLYPTMLDLAGLPPPGELEGHSLRPLLEEPEAEWSHFARTEFGPGNYTLRSERYRYIHYADGSEEFYDHANDPHEWHNLIENKGLQEVIAEHRRHKPGSHHPILGKRSTGHRAFKAAGERTKE